MTINVRILLPGLVALALAIAGCSTGAVSASSPSVSAPGAQGTVRVVMRTLAFKPTSVHAKVGQRIEWTNHDSAPHNVEYVSGPKFTSSGPVLPPRATFSIVVTQPGTIHYFCSIHPWMTATIVVSP